MKLSLRRILTMLAVIFCLFILTNLIMRFFESEEDRLKRVIYNAKRLTEKENLIRLTDYISADYSDELGNDRRSLLLIAKNFFDEYRSILIVIDKLNIEIEEENASAFIEATVYWQENASDKIIYDNAKVRAFFKKTRDQWKLTEFKFFESKEKRLFSPLIG